MFLSSRMMLRWSAGFEHGGEQDYRRGSHHGRHLSATDFAVVGRRVDQPRVENKDHRCKLIVICIQKGSRGL
jgi:hypothetical protein